MALDCRTDVLIAGLMILASHERADRSMQYEPAQLNNGEITPGQFGQDADDN